MKWKDTKIKSANNNPITDIIMTKSIKEMYSLRKQKLGTCFFGGRMVKTNLKGIQTNVRKKANYISYY